MKIGVISDCHDQIQSLNKVMKTTLTFVRHGETDKNANSKLHKAGDPVQLNQTGINQIIKTAQFLRQKGVDVVYCSKEARAIQSANIIGHMCSCKVTQLDGLQERNWGIFTSKPWHEVSRVLEGSDIKKCYTFVPKQGESWKSFEERLINVVKMVISESATKNIAVVTHWCSIRALMPYLLDVSKEEVLKHNPANASLTTFDYCNGAFTPIVINDTSHLN